MKSNYLNDESAALPLRVGIDVGSTTVKIVVLDSAGKNILFSRYQRHYTEQAATVRKLLSEVSRESSECELLVCICGSGGKAIAEIIGAHYVQEVVATSIVARRLYPNVRTVVEIGGQDSKAIFFHHDEKSGQLTVSDMRMNGLCAGGTGAFIDEIASLLKVPIDKFDALASSAKTVHTISGRCGVFAKTDIQSTLNQGGRREDIALSAFHAVVKQTVGGLAQGLELEPPIMFAGGPITFNPTLIKAFGERLSLKESDIVVPENSETIIALGAALAAEELFLDEGSEAEGSKIGRFHAISILGELDKLFETKQSHENNSVQPYFRSSEEYETWKTRHTAPKPPMENLGEELRVYIGIDAGSTTSKFAVIDDSENIVDTFYSKNNGDPLRIIKQGLLELQKKYSAKGTKLKVCGFGTTGYGELMFAKAFGADYHAVETVSHAAAAKKYVPDVSFILDIGGQDMKAIWVKDGVITNITLNEACSSGCGSFLETFADSLGIVVEDIAKLAFQSKNAANLGSRCTVFMNSTIITEQKNGKQSDDIMAGLCRAVVENAFTKVIRVTDASSLGKRIVVQGGTIKNDAVLRALEQYLEQDVFRAPYPGEMGCIGVALLTKRQIEKMNKDVAKTELQSSFIGFDALEKFDYTQMSNVPCTACANHCSRTQIIFSNGRAWVTGNRCEIGDVVSETNGKNTITKKKDAVPDIFLYREKLLFRPYDFTSVSQPKNITIGIPRVLEFWESMPFWTTFFKALGFDIKISRPSSVEQYEKGIPFVVSDTICFPAKIVHGHIQDLVSQSVDRIFMPMIMEMPSESVNEESNHVCPVLKGYSYVVRNSENPEARWGIKFDAPIFHWFDERDKKRQIVKYMSNEYGISKIEVTQAIKQGEAALKLFHTDLVAKGAEIIEQAKKSEQFAVVLAGRPYHNDSFVSHDLSRAFTKEGIPVLSLDSLPDIADVSLRNTRVETMNNYHMRLLSGGILAAKSPELEYVQIVSFGCGHDSILSNEITRIMSDVGGKIPLILKIDEGDAVNSLYIRIKSFINTVSTQREANNFTPHRELIDAYPKKFIKEDIKTRTVLVPNASAAFCTLMSSVLTRVGLKIYPLPMGGEHEIMLGKKYVHNDTCFPAQIVIGEAISVLQSGKYKKDEVAVAMAKLHGDCRLSHYPALLRLALNEAGFEDVPIITTDATDSKDMHPGIKLGMNFELPGIWVLLMLDTLEELRRQIRPYELNQGDIDRVFDQSINRIAAAIEKGIGKAIDAFKDAIDDFCLVPYDMSNPKPKVFITGEFLVNFHPGSNFNMEKYLEDNGMEVILPRLTHVFRKDVVSHISYKREFNVGFPISKMLFTYAKDGVFTYITKRLDKIAEKHPLYAPHISFAQLADNVTPIMHRTYTSGEGWLIPAEIKEYAEMGVNAFVLLQPFGCLPNHICGRGTIKRIKDEFPFIQILPIDLDPDSSFANIENRLQMLIINEKNRFRQVGRTDTA
ncbi:MAG: acyl-CoA dehydratase activase [Oscillospiraceae bacterium]|nr:acyl-CoA dehydratase activase [Oscillospiraceae bacterium]